MNDLSKLPKLIPLKSGDGAYCDLETGECYPATTGKDSATVTVGPVCNMEVKVETAQHKAKLQGQTYYFCSADCQQAFEREPLRYLAGKPVASV